MSANGSTASKNNTKGFLRAVKANDIATVRKYIEAGLDINTLYDMDMPLYIAIQANNVDMVRFLIGANAALNTLVEGDSLLYKAVEGGNTKIVELLLKAGADPSFQNIDRKTPLFKAVETQSVKNIQLLCEYNADPKYSVFGETPMSVAKTERVKQALEACVPERTAYKPTAKQIQSMITNLIETKGTFPIQSQKTGQCFSDSIQHALYFADGIRDTFIERAVKRYSDMKAAGELPLTKEQYLASMSSKIQEKYKRQQEYYKKNLGRNFATAFEDYFQYNLPKEAANLYLDYTGVRFLDMFLRPLLQAPASTKTIAARRPSVVSFFSEQPMGIVCSQTLGIYQIVQSIYKDRRHYFAPGVTNEPRVSRPNNYPSTLNVEGAGFLTDLTEYELWTELLNTIPSEKGVGIIKGETDITQYEFSIESRRATTYTVDPKYIVAVLFSVFPESEGVRRNFSAGHALSLVKVYGKWYLCDDNIGVALPTASFTMEDLFLSKFKFRYNASKIEYYLFDEIKLDTLIAAARKTNPGRRTIEIPESEYIKVLAVVPLKRAYASRKVFSESVIGGAGGFMDTSFSRKYVAWQPAVPASVADASPPLNETLRALASRYGILTTSHPAAGSGE
jgi:hypothetical protein